MFQLLSVVFIEVFIALSIYSTGAEARPTNRPECRPGEFYDDIVFKWRKCSICFTPEGDMFAWNCNHCKCKKESTPAPTTTPTTTPAPETTPPTTTNDKDIQVNVPTTGNTTSQEKKSGTTVRTSSKDEPGNDTTVDWKYPVFICVGIVVVLAMIGITIFFCRKKARSQQQGQGCFKPAKHGTPCTDNYENPSSPGTPQNSSTNTLSHGYFPPPYNLDPSGQYSLTNGYSGGQQSWV